MVGLFYYENTEKGWKIMAIIKPEIFASAVNEALRVNLKAGILAFDATDMVGEIRQAGDTVHFPHISRIQDAEELSDGVAIDPERINMNDTKAVLKEVGQGVRVLDKEEIQIKGGAMDKIIEQLGQSMAKKIDLSLIEAMDADAVYKVPQTKSEEVTLEELNACIAEFGDQIDSDTFAGWLVNSRLVPSLMNMDAFVSTAKTFTTDGSGVVKNGIVGYLYNVPVYVTNNGTYDTVKSETKTYLLKKEALSYVIQKDVTVEEEREAKLRATDIVTTTIMATKLLDPKGCVILRKTTA